MLNFNFLAKLRRREANNVSKEPTWYGDLKLGTVETEARGLVLLEESTTGNERAVIIDEASSSIILSHTSNSPSSVTFPEQIEPILSDPRQRLAIHHNHPTRSALSGGDLHCLASCSGVQSVWVHHGDLSSFCCRKTGEKTLSENVVDVCVDHIAKFLASFSRKELPNEYRATIASHSYCTALQIAGFVDYKCYAESDLAELLYYLRPKINMASNLAAAMVLEAWYRETERNR